MRPGHSRARPARPNRRQFANPKPSPKDRRETTPAQVPPLDWPVFLFSDNVPVGDLIAETFAFGQECPVQMMMR
jgi:hypothetical protein